MEQTEEMSAKTEADIFDNEKVNQMSAMSAIIYVELLELTKNSRFVIPGDVNQLSEATGKSVRLCLRFVREVIENDLAEFLMCDIIALKPVEEFRSFLDK